MICYEDDCSAQATVGYERHKGDTVVVTGYCEDHDPHPEQPFDTPFDPTDHNETSE